MSTSEALQIALAIPVGTIFGASSLPKLRHPRAFVFTVLEYRVLPERAARLYARVLPPLELALAAMLLAGLAVRVAAAVACLLLSSFGIAMAINLARGRTLECGCGPRARRLGPSAIIEDIVLLGGGLATVALSRTAALGPWPGLIPTVPHPLDVALIIAGALGTGCSAVVLGRIDRRRWYAHERNGRTL